ncbi:MAG: hypothetical protein A2W35_18660 [Chloroflexi bacterium RBG_16_57_11]|nr:MAG: hypothetical protein A2W35_18660 [Chloroflexi bacterium RBG_16_57_11]
MKTRLVFSLFLLFILVLTACASAAQKAPQQAEAPAEPAMAEAPVVEQVVEVQEAPAAVEAGVAPESEAPKPQEASLPQLLQPSTRMIIKDGLMDLLVADTEVALERVIQLAADQGGYIVSSRVWMDRDYKNAELRMGVPSITFEDTMNKLRRIGVEVLNEQASGQDVSAEYNDLQSQLVNLEATAARVRDFLDQAKTVEESLRINATLSDLEGQIEQVKGQMKFYEDRSAYSTITVTLSPQMPTPTPTLTPTVTPTPTPTPSWNPGKTVASASKVMVDLLKGLIDLTIWAAFLLWPFVLVALIAWVIYRRIRRKPASPPPPPPPPSPESG